MSDSGGENNIISLDFKRSALSKKASKNHASNLSKREIFGEWIQKGMVSVLLDARKLEAQVPPDFKAAGDLRLNFCYDFHVPDFNFNEEGLWATLSYPQGDFFTKLAWSCIFGMQSQELGQAAAWFDDFPSDYDEKAVLGIDRKEYEELLSRDQEKEYDSDAQSQAKIISVDFGNKH